MATNIFIKGTVVAVTSKTYNDVETVRAQFLVEDEEKGFSVVQVKLTEKKDIERIAKEMVVSIPVSIPVSIAVVNNTLFFTQKEEATINGGK